MVPAICDELRSTLKASMERNRCDAMLLSGGLDSGIIASMSSGITAITISYGDAPDLRYARIIAERYGMKHLVKRLSMTELEDAVENIVRIMRSFDPMEVRNSTVLYASLSELRNHGFRNAMTGDGGDELFAGYNYLLKIDGDKLEQELQRLWGVMHFSSITIGRELGIEVKSPYLDREFVEFAKQVHASLKVREQDGRRWGKWILRSCFQDDVTPEIAWRTKMPLQEGAGTDALTAHFEKGISGDEFNAKARHYAEESVRIRGKEHLRYYEVYRRFFAPPREASCEYRCPECQGCVTGEARFCNTCGGYPIRPSRR